MGSASVTGRALAPARSSQAVLKSRTLSPYAWSAPLLLTMGAVLVGPWAYSLGLSFYSWSPLRETPPRFVGLGNYVATLTDPAFQGALARTLALVLVAVVLELVLGFGVALLLVLPVRGKPFFHTAFLIPMMITPAAVGLVWRVLLHDELGLVNWALRTGGLPAVGWLSDPDVTLVTILLIEVWQHTPFVILVLGAALATVPTELIEAARVDGAAPRAILRHVVIPWLSSMIVIVVLFRVIFVLRTFDAIYALFRSGGPDQAGTTLGVYLYESLRVHWDLGRSSAVSYLILLLTLLASSGFAVRARHRGND